MVDAAESFAASPAVLPAPLGPVRTCVGCRRRAAAADLLRVAVEAVEAPGQPGRLRLDPRRNAPGRGAWLHPDPSCAELAERRRAFARALRVPVGTDVSAVVAAVAGLVEIDRPEAAR